MIHTKNLVWLDLSNVKEVPKYVQIWLNDDQSLTAKLKNKFDDFSVEVLSQKQTIPHADELDMLDGNIRAIIREVNLLGNCQVVVFARSIIPMTNDTKDLLSIGSKPLGEILFHDPNIKRGKMQITHKGNMWGRRSIFIIGQTKVLVSEFFLESLYA